MAVFATQNSKRRYLQIAESLVETIKGGTCQEGSRLRTERELAEEYSVSRTTIREALLALEIKGYVKIQVGAGVFVLPQRNWNANSKTFADDEVETGPHEILDLRRVLEARAAYLAAEHATTHQIEQLRASVTVMGKNITRMSIFDRTDNEFHMIIAKMSNNTLLED